MSGESEIAPPQGVLIGLSGGVDSAVAASMLVDDGYHVVGVTLRLWAGPTSGLRRTVGSAEAVERAKAVAEGLGIAHRVVDAHELFAEKVIAYFVDEYAAGRTPNPCMKCNARVRFGLLLDIARGMGLSRIATGHYARLVGESRSLARAVDKAKDQSYVLAEVDPRLLRQAVFPLGGMTKAQVRARAVEAGLSGYSSAESQEICFIPDNDHKRFLRDRLGRRPGAVIDGRGEVLGSHSGTYNFTIGQRRGIGVAAQEPLYVLSLRAERDEVVVGREDELSVAAVTIGGIVRHRQTSRGVLTAQLRSTGGAVPAHMADARTIVLEKPLRGIAPGQTAVLYEDEDVVLAGTILATRAWG